MSIQFKFYVYILYFWARSVIFRGKLLCKLEKFIQTKKLDKHTVEISPYLVAFDQLLTGIASLGLKNVKELKVLEIGTGQNLIIPILLRLIGVKEVTTADINNLIVTDLVVNCVRELIEGNEIEKVLAAHGLKIDDDYYQVLKRFIHKKDIYSLGLSLHHDVDLSQPKNYEVLRSNDVDLVISNDVLEHIPIDELRNILISTQAVYPHSRHLHIVDLTDHFSHVIPGLPKKNFIQYSEFQWSLIAGNRMIYQNRLTVGDYEEVFSLVFPESSIEVIDSQTEEEIKKQSRVFEKYVDISGHLANKILVVV